jgi:hypothetical protein
MSVQYQRLFRVALIGVYVAIPIAVTFGTYEGWLFQSSTPNATSTNIVVVGLIALLAATMLAEHLGVFQRAASGRDVLKAVGYWLGALLWVAAIVRLVPDNRIGGSVLIGPLSALMLAGMFHLARFAGTFTRSLTTAIMTATPVAVAPPISGSTSSLEVSARSGESTEPDRVDIAANVGQIALRFLGGTAAFLILPQVLRGTSYDGFYRGIFYVGAIILGALAIRSLSSRGPALSLASDGISIRRDLCAIRHLSWAQIIGFEMKSSVGNTFLVIHVKDANGLIAQRGPISRWFMGQSLAMFGSPVRIPIGWLKCDPNSLWQKANEMLMANRGPREGN